MYTYSKPRQHSKVIDRWTEEVTKNKNPFPVDGLVIAYEDYEYSQTGTSLAIMQHEQDMPSNGRMKAQLLNSTTSNGVAQQANIPCSSI